MEQYLEKGEVTDEFKNVKSIEDLISDVWYAADYDEEKVNEAIQNVSLRYEQHYSSLETLLQDLEDATIEIYQSQDETIARCVLDWKTIGRDEDNFFAQYVLMADCVLENDKGEFYSVVELDEKIYEHPEFEALLSELNGDFEYHEDKHQFVVTGGGTRGEIIEKLCDLRDMLDIEPDLSFSTEVGQFPTNFGWYSLWHVCLSEAYDWPELSDHEFKYLEEHEHMFKDAFSSVRGSIVSGHP